MAKKNLLDIRREIYYICAEKDSELWRRKMTSAQLLGKSAIVTGASGGIGRSIAYKLAEAGAGSILTYHTNREAADQAARRARSVTLAPIVIRQFDITKPKDIVDLINFAQELFGSIDILVNNAGFMAPCSILDDLPKLERKTWEINVVGPCRLTRAVLPSMVHHHFGRIINISSTTGLVGSKTSTLYGMSKAALDNFTKCVAKAFGQYHITANSIAASTIAAGMFLALPHERRKAVESETALKRMGQPDEVGGFVAYLASDEAEYLTGQIIVFDGGRIT